MINSELIPIQLLFHFAILTIKNWRSLTCLKVTILQNLKNGFIIECNDLLLSIILTTFSLSYLALF